MSNVITKKCNKMTARNSANVHTKTRLFKLSLALTIYY